ncbi:MAG: LysR family transcriptional regulator [Phascolarctobacterium faecium]
MTLTQMRYFYEVCKWRSITKAAASLHISQPTVSIAMADLEKESGLNLFRREGKKLSLTEDGSLLLSKITPILANLRQQARHKDMAQNKNLIRLAVPLQIGVQLLPTLFRDFKNLYPEIELEVVEAGGIDSLRMIENEELDLAVTNYDDSFSPNLHYRKLFKSEACFCTYPDHPLAQKKYVDTKILNPLVL